MTSRQWYTLLLEDNVTMETDSDEAARNYIPCKAEKLNPTIDWQRIWQLARLKGLDSNQTSFLWKLLHSLLPTLNRVNRINPKTSPICQHCNNNLIEDLSHAFFGCSFNRDVAQNLIDILSNYQPNLTISKILTIDFEVEENLELPMVWTTSNFLSIIWDYRKDKRKCDLIRARADLEAKVSLLRKTKFKVAAETISQMLVL